MGTGPTKPLHWWPFYVVHWEPEWREELEERVAIMEFDGGLARPFAESAAVACVMARRNAWLKAKQSP